MVVVVRFAAAEPLLFVVSGSAVDASARAALTSGPLAGAVTVTPHARGPPFGTEATAGQVTTPPDWVPPLSAETNVTPAGRVSLTTTESAAVGPLLLVTIV